MPAANKPTNITLRAYNVGFGDCFLLTFHYPKQNRHVLIDFGSTAGPVHAGDDFMKVIAEDIEKQCSDGKLVGVVATHRHRDHVSGFATGGDGTGEIIAGLAPDLVLQPWTEDPAADPKALKATTSNLQFRAALQDMHAAAGAVWRISQDKAAPLGARKREQLRFLGDDNLPNRSAVVNLMNMAANEYLNCGAKTGLAKLLPGVKVHVLGPPDLTQTETIRKQRSKDKDEFWHLRKGFAAFQSYWKAQALAGSKITAATPLFPNADRCPLSDAPPHTRWFTRRLDQIRGTQLLELVRSLDRAMNNTSLILLLQVGDFAMLFPGDAQIENWSFALSQEKFRKLLAGVSVYKVGHHGSLNATPKSLWKLFEHKDHMHSVLSTRSGKHGDSRTGTEVPRQTLVTALKTQSNLVTTQDLKKNDLCHTLTWNLTPRTKRARAGG